MASFDVSKKWIIIVPAGIPHAMKSVRDLSRCIGLLAAGCADSGAVNRGGSRAHEPPEITEASAAASSEAIIVLNSEGSENTRNGFEWRAGMERVEIYGESERGLCNGIYSFLSALGISWPLPGREKLPSRAANDAKNSRGAPSAGFPLSIDRACEPSRFEGENPAAAPWKRFVPAGKREIQHALKESEAFAAWAARNHYDALVFPLWVFASQTSGRKLTRLRQAVAEYGIALEAGGRELSSFVPRKYFLFHRDCFRMEEGGREKKHHFCPTSPGALKIIDKEGKKMFRAAGGVEVFHIWPDKGAETAWCSCPTCRAFTFPEQNRMGVNAAADALLALNPRASITCFEKPGETGKIPLRKNIQRIETLPEEKEF